MSTIATIEEQLPGLRTHLRAYQLGDLATVAEEALRALAAAGAARGQQVRSGPFLHADSALTCTLLTSGNSFLFWLAAATPPMKLAVHFPQLLPFSPWGLLDTDPFPFPHLAGVELAGARWDYVYLHAEDGSDATRRGLTDLLDAELFGPLGPETGAFAKASGGLYYRGGLALGRDALLPAGSYLAGLLPAALAVEATGYVAYRRGVLPTLALQIPLFDVTGQQLGFGKIDHVSLALELASSLNGPRALAETGGRRVGVVGHLVIGHTRLTLAGSWPLDDDDVQLSLACGTDQLSTWFADTSLAGLPWPTQAGEAAVSLVISKQSGQLEKAGFTFENTEWVIPSDGFGLTLQEVKLAVTVLVPASLKLTLASFAAKARIGSTQLLCTGQYPDGEYFLGLDPATPLHLDRFVAALSPGGNGVPGFPQALAITELSGRYHAATGYKAFALTMAEVPGWNTGGADRRGFDLRNLSLGIYGESTYTFKLSADFRYAFVNSIRPVELHFTGSAEYQNGWTLSLHYSGAVSLKDLAEEFGMQRAPDELGDFVFQELDFVTDTETGTKYFHGKGSIRFEGVDAELELQVNHTKTGTAFSTAFTGQLNATIGGSKALLLVHSSGGARSELDVKLHFTVAGVTVELEAQTGGSGNGSLGEMHFVGMVEPAPPLHLATLLEELLTYGDVALPQGFIPDFLELHGIYVSYDGKARKLDLVAVSIVGGKEVRFFFQYQLGSGQYALGIETTTDQLRGLPLIGSELEEVQLQNIGFVHLSGASAVALPALSGASGGPRTLALSGPLPTDYVQGFNLKGSIKLPMMEPLALRLPVANHAAVAPPAASPAGTAPATPAVAPRTAAGQVPAVPSLVATRSQPLAAGEVTKWFELDAKLGPLHISQVGLSYVEEKLYLLIGLDLTLAGLEFSADGLGLGFTPQKLLKGEVEIPAFKLAGLGLSYNNGPVQISGAFLHGKQPVMGPDGHPVVKNGQEVQVDAYSGGAIVKFENFTITGLGSYATYESEPSLFVYALYDGALGGPSFFFVTGLSIGFGYNRKVNVPAFDHVARFPLVRMAMDSAANKNTTIASLLHDLDTVDPETNQRPIDIAMGEYWLAVGVKFTTFEMVYGYLLLIAEFGHHLQFTVLGVAELTLPMPPEGPALRDDLKLVYLKMQMAAVLIPSEGYFSVAGSLTPDSYVLTKDCHITGGFAYSMWYDSPEADKNGQFVMTAGGFHPAFVAPSYFPQVPRLGYIWQVSDVVSIKGQSYYALTSSCGMAGTSLEVLFESGDIKAWFIAKADMLVTWHPLSFVAEVYVELGVSVRLNLLFCHKTVSLSISAGLTLWGPPLGGRVEVHVIIVTLTIGFGSDGSDDKNRKPLPWKSSAENPKGDNFRALLPNEGDVCKILAGSGVTQPKPTSKRWVVRAGTFSFTAQSAIPISQLTSNVLSYCAVGDVVRIRPMNLAAVDSTFNLTIAKDGAAATEAGAWTMEPVFSSVAAALWGQPLRERSGSDEHFVQAPSTPSNDVVKNQLIGCRVQAPAPESSESFGIIGLKQLAFDQVAEGSLAFAGDELRFNYRAVAPRPQPASGAAAPAASPPASPIAQTSAKRQLLFEALSCDDLYHGPNDDLRHLQADYGALFKDDPMLYSVPA